MAARPARAAPRAATGRAGVRRAPGRDLAGALSDDERVASDLAAARQIAAQVRASRAYRTAVRGRTTVENVVRAPSRWQKKRRGEL